MTDFAARRERMVERQLRRRGIDDERVLGAMGEVPRELFVDEKLRRRAYDDRALPTRDGQTISQPWVVAAITQALRLEGDETALEIGTGSGYSTAVLAGLCARVVSIESHPRLAADAAALLDALGIDNVELRAGDGSLGAADAAPFDAIAVHAAAPAPPPSLLAQLADGGRLVIPVAERGSDMLTAYIRTAEGLRTEPIAACRFVPLLGEEGFEGGL